MTTKELRTGSQFSSQFFGRISWSLLRATGILRIDPASTSCASRGVDLGADAQRDSADGAAAAFVHGLTRVVALDDPDELSTLEGELGPRAGFVAEGAAMGAVLRDVLAPGRSWWPSLLARTSHPYTAHCGAGWACHRLGISPRRVAVVDPLLRWLAWDGLAFSRSFAAGPGSVQRLRHPARSSSTERAHLDQGLGRSLWFQVSVSDLPALVHRFEPSRHADLWGGVGLAATYAGGAEAPALERLARAAGDHLAQLRTGVVAGVRARHRGGVLTEGTVATAQVLTDRDVPDLLEVHDRALAGLDPDADPYAYSRWRQRTAQLVSSRIEVLA